MEPILDTCLTDWKKPSRRVKTIDNLPRQATDLPNYHSNSRGRLLQPSNKSLIFQLCKSASSNRSLTPSKPITSLVTKSEVRRMPVNAR